MFNQLLTTISSGIIADVIILAIVVIFAIINLKKGFFKQLVKVICAVVAVIVAYSFCDDLLTFANANFNVTQLLRDKILGLFGEGSVFLMEVTNENIATAITSLGLPESLIEVAVNALSNVASDLYSNIGEFLSQLLANYILTSVSFVLIYIVARIVLILIAKLLESIIKLPIISDIDKFLGFILGMIKALILVFFVLFIIEVLPLEPLAEVKNALSQSILGSILQKHNLFTYFINWIVANIKI